MPITKNVTIPLSALTVSGDGPAPAAIAVTVLDNVTPVGTANFPLPASGSTSMTVPVTAPGGGTYFVHSQVVSSDLAPLTAIHTQTVVFNPDIAVTGPTPN